MVRPGNVGVQGPMAIQLRLCVDIEYTPPPTHTLHNGRVIRRLVEGVKQRIYSKPHKVPITCQFGTPNGVCYNAQCPHNDVLKH